MAAGAARDFQLTSISPVSQRKHLFPRNPALKCMDLDLVSHCGPELEVLLVRLGNRPALQELLGLTVAGVFQKKAMVHLL